jgi:hypothetical protein
MIPPGLATSQNWGGEKMKKKRKKSPGSKVAYKTPIMPKGARVHIYLFIYIYIYIYSFIFNLVLQ